MRRLTKNIMSEYFFHSLIISKTQIFEVGSAEQNAAPEANPQNFVSFSTFNRVNQFNPKISLGLSR